MVAPERSAAPPAEVGGRGSARDGPKLSCLADRPEKLPDLKDSSWIGRFQGFRVDSENQFG